MPECQAYGCSLQAGEGDGKGVSFFAIPNATKKPELRDLAAQWLHRIGTGHTVKDFKFGPRKIVCEHHFSTDCFTDDPHIRMSLALGKKPRYTKVLKPDAVPTIFVHRPLKPDGGRKERAKQRDNKKVVAALVKGPEVTRVDPEIVIPTPVAAQRETPSLENLTLDPECSIVHDAPKMMDASVQTDPVCIIDKDEEKKTYPVNTVALKLDHAYSSKKPSQPQTCSTPRKRKRFSVEPLPALPLDGSGCDTSLEECLSPIEDLAISKEMSPDDLEHSDDFEEIYDPKDETYEQCSEEKSELEDSTFTTPSTSTSFVDERKFIVFESCLQSLCRRVRCSECDSPADEVKLTVCGSACQVKVLCIMGHMSLSWNSQPVSGKMPLGNLLLAGSVLFSGETFGRVDHMFSLINLQFIGATTYNDMQKNHLIPAVHQAWVQEKEAVRTELAGKPVLLGGDGRCDSPGFSAKYCSYTLMDQTTDKILTLQLVQVTETGSSSKMEVLGYERAMDEVLEAGYDVKVCATDRHVQVRKLHKDKYLPLGIQHEFDVYHLANTIRKKLRAKAKTKKYEKLMPWIKSVVHHLWFCAATCEKDPNILVARWQSVTNHVKNVHNFPDNALFPTCAHGPLSDDDARKKRWLTDDSPPYRALVEVVTNPRLVKDIRQLAQFCHTGMLEVYHSLLLKYAPKRQEFDYVPMQARLELAAMDHNANVNRQQARVKYPKAGTAQKGQLRYHTRWSKATERWVVVPVKEAKSYNFVADLLESVVDAKEKNQPFPPVNPPANLARNIAKTPMPCSKEQLILRKMSRF